ncbi:uncharacterized protein LOC134179445 [Corticium candelabrum]|uniref:uncharacterized protein LOC134179445 n=1 Tax=Corticium candelabrum TaxID=121492 RepID=UPI002E2767AF|nr:uncharacterized protein LOC134179445 [Corticium candelabrum]
MSAVTSTASLLGEESGESSVAPATPLPYQMIGQEINDIVKAIRSEVEKVRSLYEEFSPPRLWFYSRILASSNKVQQQVLVVLRKLVDLWKRQKIHEWPEEDVSRALPCNLVTDIANACLAVIHVLSIIPEEFGVTGVNEYCLQSGSEINNSCVGSLSYLCVLSDSLKERISKVSDIKIPDYVGLDDEPEDYEIPPSSAPSSRSNRSLHRSLFYQQLEYSQQHSVDSGSTEMFCLDPSVSEQPVIVSELAPSSSAMPDIRSETLSEDILGDIGSDMSFSFGVDAVPLTVSSVKDESMKPERLSGRDTGTDRFYPVAAPRRKMPAKDGFAESKSRRPPGRIKTTLDRDQIRKIVREQRKQYEDVLQSVKKYEVGKVASYEEPNPLELPSAPLQRLPYTMIAQLTKHMQFSLLHLLHQRYMTSIHKEVDVRHEFELVLCVDNSGSMHSKIHHALTGLVVLMETFRRMECRFAVVRFGGRKSQKTLKAFAEEMNSVRGQWIIEQFECDESTLPADALKYIAEELYKGKSSKADTLHRIILMITDGISQQTNPNDYRIYKQSCQADLIVLAMTPSRQQATNERRAKAENHYKHSSSFLADLLGGDNSKYRVLPEDEAHLLPAVISNLIAECFESVLTEIRTAGRTVRQRSFTVAVEAQTCCPGSATIIDNYIKQSYQGSHVFVSHPLATIPLLEEANNTSAKITISHEPLLEACDKLDDHYESTEMMRCLTVSEEWWLVATRQLDSLIAELQAIFDDVMFMPNKPTRSVPDTRGSRLSLPGIVQYLCTNGQYTRIFENMIGSPKRQYRVCLLADNSSSMQGPPGSGAAQALVALCEALNRCSIENFCVVTTGERVTLVKTAQQAFDGRAMHMICNCLRFNEQASYLADGLDYSLELLSQQSDSDGPMFVFVLTDGYPSQGIKLSHSLMKAEDLGAFVVAIGVGLESSGVGTVFQHYIVAQQPMKIANGLQKLVEQRGDGSKLEEVPFETVKQSKVTDSVGGEYTSVDDVWKVADRERIFADLAKDVDDKRSVILIQQSSGGSPFSIDVCFVMDCTGSMGSWIQAAKDGVHKMSKEIQDQVSVSYGRSCKLRMAFVAYRDDCDGSNRFDSIGLTESVESVRNKVSAQQATGGGDECEDIQGGLDVALKFGWTTTDSEARFIVLIADAPGHGRFCHAGDRGDGHYPGGIPGSPQMADIMNRMAKQRIHFMFVKINNSTDYMIRQMEGVYNRNEGGMELKIETKPLTDPSGPSRLAETVCGHITYVVADQFM